MYATNPHFFCIMLIVCDLDGPDGSNLDDDQLPDPADTASPNDLALLKKLADQQTISTRKKADDEEPKTDNADEKTSPTDTNASNILIPLIGGMDCDEAKNFRGVDFHWAQIIHHEDDQLVTLPMTVAKTFKNWKGANIRLSIIDTTLVHAINMIVVVENPHETSSGLPPELSAEVMFYSGKHIYKTHL